MFMHLLTSDVAEIDASEIKLPTKISASQAKTNCLAIRPQKLNDKGDPEPFHWARATRFAFILKPKPFVDRSSHCNYNSKQYIRGKFCSQLAWDRLVLCVLGNTQRPCLGQFAVLCLTIWHFIITSECHVEYIYHRYTILPNFEDIRFLDIQHCEQQFLHFLLDIFEMWKLCHG